MRKGIQNLRTNQEAAQYEEQVHAHPAEASQPCKVFIHAADEE